MKKVVLLFMAVAAIAFVSCKKEEKDLAIKMNDINVKVAETFSPFNYIEVCNDSDGIVSLSKTDNWTFNFEGISPHSSGENYVFNEPGTGTCYAVYSDGDLEIKSNVANVTVII